VFCTGTPDGVGDTMKPPRYMQDGDVVRINIEKIGTLINPIRRTGKGDLSDVVTPSNLDLIV